MTPEDTPRGRGTETPRSPWDQMDQLLEQWKLVGSRPKARESLATPPKLTTIPSSEPRHTSDLELMRRVAERDVQAQGQLVKRLWSRIYALAHHMCALSDELKDLTQEVMIEVFRSAASYRGDACVEAWAKAIAMRTILNRIGSFHYKWRKLLVFEEAPGDTALCGHPGQDHEAEVESAMRQESIRAILLKLKPRQRAAILLKLVEGHSVDEVAEIMDRHPDSVRYLLKTARKRIAELAARDPVLRELCARELS